jgi:hypothetical protein
MVAQSSRLATGAFLIITLHGQFQPDARAEGTAGCGLNSWETRPPLVNTWLRDIAYDATSGFVAVGDYGQLLTSIDGESWTLREQPVSIGFARVRRVDGRYIAMGRQFGAGPMADSWSAVLWTSSDGLAWTPRYEVTNTVVNGVASGNGMFVAIAIETGSSGVATSRSLVSIDGVQWIVSGTIAESWMYDIAFGNGIFVAVGGSRIMASDDGATWVETPVPGVQALQAVGFHLGQFIAVGDRGTILTSPDGLEWTARVSGTTALLTGIAAGGGQLAVAGSAGTVLTSHNAVDWVSRVDSRLDLRGLAYGADSFVAVGKYGTVYQSGGISACSGPRLTLTRGLQSRLDLTGQVGARHRIEYSDQLGGTWQLLLEIASLPESPYEIIDPTDSPTGQRFYRAIQLP